MDIPRSGYQPDIGLGVMLPRQLRAPISVNIQDVIDSSLIYGHRTFRRIEASVNRICGHYTLEIGEQLLDCGSSYVTPPANDVIDIDCARFGGHGFPATDSTGRYGNRAMGVDGRVLALIMAAT